MSEPTLDTLTQRLDRVGRENRWWRIGGHVLAAIILLALASPAYAGWQEGHAAFARRDYALALREWLPLAKGGHAEAQLNVAFMYNQGLGVRIDHVMAAQWYLKAAEQGLAEAQAQLAVTYSQGLGVARSYAEAFKWSAKAAEQGHPQGQFNLGAFYANGLGVPRDYTKAAFWTRKAAEQGDAASQFNLAVLYTQGLGVPRDDVEALMWLLLAPLQFKDPAISMPARGAPDIASQAEVARNFLAARMSPGQIAEAQKRAREWKPKPWAKSDDGTGDRETAERKIMEYTDNEYNYAFQFPSDWKLEKPRQPGEAGEVRLILKHPAKAMRVMAMVGHIDKGITKQQFESSPNRDAVVEAMIGWTIEQVYKKLSRDIGASRMIVTEKKLQRSDVGIEFYISTAHFIDKAIVLVAGIHVIPFAKSNIITFMMIAPVEKTATKEYETITRVFNSFHIIGERPVKD